MVHLETVKMVNFTPCIFTTKQIRIKIQDAKAYTAEFLERSKVTDAECPEPRGAQKRAVTVTAKGPSYRPGSEELALLAAQRGANEASEGEGGPPRGLNPTGLKQTWHKAFHPGPPSAQPSTAPGISPPPQPAVGTSPGDPTTHTPPPVGWAAGT